MQHPRSVLSARGFAVLSGLGLAAALSLAQARGQEPAPASRAPMVLEGIVEVLVEDRDDRSHRVRHFVETDRGRVELAFRGRTPDWASGQRIRVSGRPTADGALMEIDGDGGAQVLSTATAGLAAAQGEQRVAVILANFQDDTSQPVTAAAARTLLNDGIDGFYRENSSGLTWLAGDAFGWFTLPVSKATCPGANFADEADRAAARAGIDLSGYARRIYVFPKTSACGWAGLATVGGASSRAWINGVFDLRIVAHEFGHNLGLLHSDGLDCDRTALGDTCSLISYADYADLMGNTVAHFNPFQKERLGWLDGPGTPALATVTASGRYLVEAYAAPGLGTKALKIAAGNDPRTGLPRWYYVDYRQPVGYDANITSAGNLTRGVMVRRAIEGQADSSVVLDMTPQSDLRLPVWDLRDAALVAGARFDDPDAGVGIALAWADGQVAAVDVALAGGGEPAPTCTRAAPDLGLAGGADAVEPGAGTGYQVSLKNNDSAACAASAFDLASQLPAGWSGQLGAALLSASPGATVGTTLAVTTPAGAIAGTYSVAATASRASGGGAQASRTLAVLAATRTATVSSIALSTAKKGKNLRASALATLVDGAGVAVANASVTGCFSGATSGCATVASDDAGRAAFQSGSYKSGSVTFCVTAVSGDGLVFDGTGACRSQ